jgi:hypothetical protein
MLAVAVRPATFQTMLEPFQLRVTNAFGASAPNAVRPGLPGTTTGTPNRVGWLPWNAAGVSRFWVPW